MSVQLPSKTPTLQDVIASLDKTFMINQGYAHQNYDTLKSTLLSHLEEKINEIEKLKQENQELAKKIMAFEGKKDG